MKKGLFIFRRDLRLVDNIGFHEASQKCDRLYTCFIFTPEQITGRNHYKSDTSVQFMMESLGELAQDLKSRGGELLCFYGENSHILRVLINDLEIEGVFFNEDYTPYARERDSEVANLCSRMGVACEKYQDYYLYQPGTVKSGSGNIYKKFKPFYDKVLPLRVSEPIKTARYNALAKTSRDLGNRITLREAVAKFSPKHMDTIVSGGRSNGLRALAASKKTQAKYEKTRDVFATNTSLLSAYLKFGCVSVREVYWMFRREFGFRSEILRQLIWREFYAHILWGEPGMINPRINNRHGIRWNQNQRWFQLWCEGKTGFPIVDAAMRQLNETGWMHNRGRLVTAVFLTKVLLIDWRWGEQYFATRLVDYDIASNNGNWQWVASTGADNMPWFRTMNPWTQAREHDPDCVYIKRWVPELSSLDIQTIQKWDVEAENHSQTVKYPKPIVDFSEQRIKSLALYRRYL